MSKKYILWTKEDSQASKILVEKLKTNTRLFSKFTIQDKDKSPFPIETGTPTIWIEDRERNERQIYPPKQAYKLVLDLLNVSLQDKPSSEGKN